MTRSQLIVRHMMDVDGRTKYRGFNKAMLAAFRKDPEVIDDDVQYLEKFLGPVPDAYIINEEAKEVIWIEVEDTHRLTNDKIYRLYHIAFALDCCFWSMEVVIIDRHGNSHDFGIFKQGMQLAYAEPPRNRESNRL